MFKFFAKDIIPVIEEAQKLQCSLKFDVTDNHGVCIYASEGEYSDESKTRTHIAFAQGLNPHTDKNWQETANNIFKRLGWSEEFEADNPILHVICAKQYDLEIVFMPSGLTVLMAIGE